MSVCSRMLGGILCGCWRTLEDLCKLILILEQAAAAAAKMDASQVVLENCSDEVRAGHELAVAVTADPICIYLAIIGGTYYFVAKSSFSYIPGYYLSEVHRYTSLLAVGVGVLLFLLASFTDPGTVKAENVSQYISAYPYDDVVYSEKECSTCKIPK
uniref:Uncharacterized protein n=1 Tax=Fagus sylvatica TaxID=28930 RepID=A0A2N9F901_FAGSY